MNLHDFADNIKKTGYLLEFQVSELLRQHGWTVIHNKYYVDDQSGAVREIDLVAYKANPVQHFLVYTTLIVSCKKSEFNVWALLSKNKQRNDPNANWQPLCVWSNDGALCHMIDRPDWPKRYLAGVTALSGPEYHTFAFQELNKASGSVQNDKPIFSSITSLVKAQAYELDALPQRKKQPAIYQFNLLSVVDAGLVRLHFDGGQVMPSTLDEDVYVANYIVRGRETSARVHFVDQRALAGVLERYDKLHVHNTKSFDILCDDFYADVFRDPKKIAVFRKEFLSRIEWRVNSISTRVLSKKITSDIVGFDPAGDRLSVRIAHNDEVADALNKDEHLRRLTSDALRELYRYQGAWTFAEWDFDDIQF